MSEDSLPDEDHDVETEEQAEDAAEPAEYEYEYTVTREDAGGVVRRLGEGVAAGSVELGGDDGARIDVPDHVELEVEYEVDDEHELEVELEWDSDTPADEEKTEESDEEKAGDSDEEEAGDSDEENGDTQRPELSEVVTPVEDGSAASGARFELYQDRADEWRWRLVHRNGNVIADSGEGYARRAGARNGLESVMKNAPGATVVEKD